MDYDKIEGMGALHKYILVLLLLGTLPAWAGKERCFLHGHIESTSFSGSKRGAGVTDMIRLHMDATDATKCEQLISSYCRYNVLDRQAVPKTLKAYFVDENKKKSRVDFKISDKCKITKSTDTGEN